MKTTADFLDDLRAKLGLPSDYALAAYLDIKVQQVSHYRKLKGTFSEEWSLKIADILEVDPAYIVACMHYQREKNEEVKRLWERIAARMSVAAALVAICALPVFSFNEPGQLVRTAFDNNGFYASDIYIVRAAGVVSFVVLALLFSLMNRKHEAHPR